MKEVVAVSMKIVRRNVATPFRSFAARCQSLPSLSHGRPPCRGHRAACRYRSRPRAVRDGKEPQSNLIRKAESRYFGDAPVWSLHDRETGKRCNLLATTFGRYYPGRIGAERMVRWRQTVGPLDGLFWSRVLVVDRHLPATAVHFS